MRAVLDTNVFISAVISSGAPYRIYAAWLDGTFELVISPVLMAELQEILARPHISELLRWPPAHLDEFLSAFYHRGVWVDPTTMINRLTADPDDNRVLEAAVEGQADYIVTGDRHILDLETHGGIEIVTPRRFLAILTREATNE
jgi:uncharacterized protein